MPSSSPSVASADVSDPGSCGWSRALAVRPPLAAGQAIPLGIIPGEGIGPEVIQAALQVAGAVAQATDRELLTTQGGAPRGQDRDGQWQDLAPGITPFCQRQWDLGGAVLCGPGGGRFVYELRRQLDLFLKISPLHHTQALIEASPLKPDRLTNLDILLLRENTGGLYQGQPSPDAPIDSALATHQFSYSESQVMRFLTVAARIAAQRSGHLSVVWKESGVPAISRLWKDCLAEVAATEGVTTSMIDVDLMAYRLIAEPDRFDVVAAPNLFGDVLADLGANLIGGRSLSFSGNFTPAGFGLYQTNHGAAYDLAGQNVANPVGQIYSLAMLLHESLGLKREADAIRRAVQQAWSAGLRTADNDTPGAKILSTSDFASHVAEHAAANLGR